MADTMFIRALNNSLTYVLFNENTYYYYRYKVV